MTDVDKSYPSEMRSRLVYLAAELRLRGGVYALWAEDVERTIRWSDAMRSDMPALKRLSEAATDGPWEPYVTKDGDPYVAEAGRMMFGAITNPENDRSGFALAAVSTAPDDYGKANVEFLAAAANYVRSILEADAEANKKDFP